MNHNNTELFNLYKNLKKDGGFKYYDTHTHPFDVLGITDKTSGINNKDEIKPSLLEKLKFNDLSLGVLDKIFRYLPRYIENNVIKSFSQRGVSHFIEQMNESGIDVSTLVPVSPFLELEHLNEYASERFIKLGSINIHSVTKEEIPVIISNQIKTQGIRGIKLHPNIQRFYPNPADNPKNIREKLEIIYSTVNKENIYILFHGGISYIKSSKGFEKVDYADLKNFHSENKEFLREIKVPIVLAHLGIYNVIRPDIDLIGEISTKYDNIFFDTAAVNQSHIINYTKKYGLSRLVFGSDAKYFNMKYAVKTIINALQCIDSNLSLEERILTVFNKNYELKILRNK